MPSNHSYAATKIISSIGYGISAAFFMLYGPGLWLLCRQSCLAHETCSNGMGLGMSWAMLSFIGIWVLLVALVLDLVAFLRIKISWHPNARRIGWLNGSSVFGILVCIVSFFLHTAGAIGLENCSIVWGIQASLLMAIVIIPLIFAPRQ